MTGRIFAIVGPSGAGKDTLMEAAKAARPDLHLVRRAITRPEAAGGENFEGISEAEFDRRLEQGDFALHWPAHGLRYGIPATVHPLLGDGQTVLFNGSRAMLGAAQQVFPTLQIILITARPEVLAKRLAQRGRETEDDILRRLERAKIDLAADLPVTEVDNSGQIEDAVTRMLRIIDTDITDNRPKVAP